MADVTDLINDARGYAATTLADSRQLIDQAQSAIGSLDGRFSIGTVNFDAPPVVDISDDVPEFQAPEFAAGEVPVAPTNLANLPGLDVGSAPVNEAVNPGFIEPPRPSQLQELNLAPPTINTSFTFPSVPDELQSINIVAPTLPDRTAPTAPELQMPVFDAVAPTDDISAPTDQAAQFEAAYRGIAPTMISALDGQVDAMLAKINPRFQEQMGRLEDRLAAYIDGDTALSPAVENAIYERAKDKNNAEYRRTRDAAYADAARRGFTLPPGALISAVQQARQGAANNNARAAVDIAVKQAELEQQNVQFAITTSTSLRTALISASIGYHQNLISLNGQALDYAKSILSAMIETYNTLVKAYGLRLDAYKAEASVYEVRLKGVLALVEIYKAEISALEALTQLDMAKITVYRSRLDALNTLASVYRSQIDAVIGQATVEKMKVELFGAQVQAYGTQAQAKNAEWQGYSAAVGGQEARIRAYGEEIRAYTAQIEGFRATVQAKQAEVENVTKYNQGVLAQYTAGVDAYRTLTDARSKVASTQIENQRVKLYAFTAKVGAQESKARMVESYYKTRLTLGQEGYRSTLQAVVSSAEIVTKQIEAVANTSLSGARIYANVASSALSGMNTLVTKQDPSA